MSGHRFTFHTQIEVIVEINFPVEDVAEVAAWDVAEEYLRTLTAANSGDYRIKSVEASLDGVGADVVEETP